MISNWTEDNSSCNTPVSVLLHFLGNHNGMQLKKVRTFRRSTVILLAPTNRASYELAKSMRTWFSSVKSNRRQGRQKLRLTLKWRHGFWWCIVFFCYMWSFLPGWNITFGWTTFMLCRRTSVPTPDLAYLSLCVISTRWGPYQSQMRAPINGRKSTGFTGVISPYRSCFLRNTSQDALINPEFFDSQPTLSIKTSVFDAHQFFPGYNTPPWKLIPGIPPKKRRFGSSSDDSPDFNWVTFSFRRSFSGIYKVGPY